MDPAELDRIWRALCDAEIPMPKEIDVSIRAAATDALADELDAICVELGVPMFSIDDLGDGPVLWSSAKVYGNPWALYGMLCSLRTLSVRAPMRTFAIQLQPDGETGTLREGRFRELSFATIERWVTSYPPPRLGRDAVDPRDIHARIVAKCAGPAREQLCDWLTTRGVPWRAVGGIEANLGGGMPIASALSTMARTTMFAPTPKLTIDLAVGSARWTCTATSFDEAFSLELVVTSLLSKLRQPEASPVAVQLPESRELASLAIRPGESLVLTDDELREYELASEGGFSRPADPTDRVIAAAPPPFRRVPFGFAGETRVLLEQFLQLGRIRTRVVLHAADGEEWTTRTFINTSAIVVAGDRIVLTEERDGVPVWTSIDVKEITAADHARGSYESTHRYLLTETELWRDPAAEPHTRVFHDGELFGIVDSGDESRIVRYSMEPASGGVRPAEIIATFRGVIDRQSVDADERLWFVVVDPDSDEATLLAVELRGGHIERAALGTGRSSAFAIARTNPPWIAWASHDAKTIRVLHGHAPRCELAATEVYDLAISPTGALAVVRADGEGQALDVHRGDAHVQVTLAQMVGVCWRVYGSR